MSDRNITDPVPQSTRPDEIPITEIEAERIYQGWAEEAQARLAAEIEANQIFQEEWAAAAQRRLAAEEEAEQFHRERSAAEAQGRPGWRPIPAAEFQRRLTRLLAPVEHRSVPRRRARRAPRRAPARRATTSARKSGGDSGDGDADPGDGEPPLARSAVTRVISVAAPLVVTDAPGMAHMLEAVGLTPRQLREIVELYGIPHSRRHAGARHILVRVDDVLAALGLAEPAAAMAPEPEQSSSWCEDEIIQRAARGRKDGAS